MSRPERHELDVPAEVDVGDPQNVYGIINLAAEIGAFDGTIKLLGMIANEDITIAEVVGDPSNPQRVDIAGGYHTISVEVTDLTGDPPAVVIIGNLK